MISVMRASPPAAASRTTGASIAIAAGHDFHVWPDLKTHSFDRTAILLCTATSKENSRAIDLLWQLSKDRTQTLGRREPEIRRRQFSPIENAKFPAGIIDPAYSFYQRPGGLRAAAFHPEDALTGFHDCLSLALFPDN